ncbi:MAG: UDP-glucose 4-epimerase GalE [Aminobacterium sp.]|jgi:UDP-glucose 4-epimerase|nr:UDP-glucose 4-epimerase GalE [Aminobacterium sp.]MDD3427035.1 UDP-glucose 4-epimerase GalE [Aminobacterium sp.]MDD3707938.1 UDP-glucose 4-epimerase GalE [Aminobacterium sp.]MDD4229464.1 UDP-glucose 4-epimerase GalE [Aminobacterium sp.]MDD4550987.1 UDP-glucose 4-epimerase GalE [Aminobacterium sp.]
MILVTGGAGYIGSVAVLALQKAGFEVVVLDNFSRGHKDLVFSRHVAEGDLRNETFVQKVFDSYPIEGVLHFAALSLVGESMKEPEFYYWNNVTGTLNLLRAMRKHNVSTFVLSSTAAVYGEPEEIPVSEEALKKPTNVYGETKLFLESVLDRYHDAYGLKSIAFRYFNAAGADPQGRTGEDHSPETHLIPLVLDVALNRRPSITVFGQDYLTQDGTCIRDYVHVTDLAHAHVLGVQRLLSGQAERETYNLGNGNGYSVLDIIKTVRKVTKHPIPVIEGPRRWGDPAKLVASSKKAMDVLEWEPHYASLEQIIETAWVWHQKRFK